MVLLAAMQALPVSCCRLSAELTTAHAPDPDRPRPARALQRKKIAGLARAPQCRTAMVMWSLALKSRPQSLALKSKPLMYLSQTPMASQKMKAHSQNQKNLYARCQVHYAPEIIMSTFKFSLSQEYLVIWRLA